jgi:hypothetical protein
MRRPWPVGREAIAYCHFALFHHPARKLLVRYVALVDAPERKSWWGGFAHGTLGSAIGIRWPAANGGPRETPIQAGQALQ